MAPLKGKVETEIEIKAPAEKFYNIFKSRAHHVPNISSGSIQGVQVHEGDWETHGSIKSWNYSVGDEVGVFKEKVEYNDENKSITLNGVEGDVFRYFKSFKPVYQFTQKDEGSTATLSIAYEKLNDNVAAPDKYVGLMVNIVKDLDAHFIKA
ncbi:MLP-like protein 28 [Prunus avium]|uniref:MLP-like protein 28 n=1 Tax=Prunus avium TaxID=42229 RepID=A0A6P5T7W8_PRUAV|nr:MLP-like protein 28 [Prunus avium]